jgi:methyl-accepting chemotaxis protein
LTSKQQEIDRAFGALQAVNLKLGAQLQFTDAGLRQRKREHVQPAAVFGEWEALKAKAASLSAEDLAAQHAHLVTDIRTLITHMGDTSNLILDPDLDSYYLMDATLIALPQTQDRLATLTALGDAVLRRPTLTPVERTQLAVQVALLKEGDLDRITGDVQTALNEDANFNGVSESLQSRLPPAVKEYTEANEALIALIQQCAGPDKTIVTAEAFGAAGNKAREASFKLWHIAIAELDGLLDRRIANDVRARNSSLLFAGLALLVSVGVATVVSRGLNRTLTASSLNIQSGALEFAQSAAQFSSASQSLAAGSSEQARALDSTSSALEQMSALTRNTASSSLRAKNLAAEARQAADNGVTDLSAMDGAMDEIKASSDSIAKIIKTIDEIAFQTNILALNAAVEAARAGAAGMGFAVVADEVRRLAQRSAQAAHETADLIESSIQRSDRGVQISARVAHNLKEIAAKTREVDELVAEIATASSEQKQGVEHINSSVRTLDQVIHANSAAAEETASGAEELSAQASTLQEIVCELLKLVGQAGSNPESAKLVPSMSKAEFAPSPSRKRNGTHTQQLAKAAGQIPQPSPASKASSPRHETSLNAN